MHWIWMHIQIVCQILTNMKCFPVFRHCSFTHWSLFSYVLCQLGWQKRQASIAPQGICERRQETKINKKSMSVLEFNNTGQSVTFLFPVPCFAFCWSLMPVRIRGFGVVFFCLWVVGVFWGGRSCGDFVLFLLILKVFVQRIHRTLQIPEGITCRLWHLNLFRKLAPTALSPYIPYEYQLTCLCAKSHY